jgi:hypothetical protein
MIPQVNKQYLLGDGSGCSAAREMLRDMLRVENEWSGI